MKKNLTISVIFAISILGVIAITITGEGVTASYYSDTLHGELTASGEKYDRNKLTAAHKTYPFGTIVEITNLSNGKKVEVRINDRGPFIAGRTFDLSYAAAEEIGMINVGTALVKIKIIKIAK